MKGVKISVLTPGSSQNPDVWPRHYDVHRFSYAPQKRQTLAQLPGGIPTALKHDRKNYLLVPSFLASFAWNLFVLRRKFDLILANWAVCGALASSLAPFHRKPVVTVLRGSDAKNKADGLSYLLKKALKGSAAVVCVGEDMKNRLTQTVPCPEKIYFIPNGVHEAFFALDPPRPEKTVNILFAGSFIPGKGADILLKAVYKLKQEKIHLFLAGQGPLEQELKNMSKQLAIEHLVSFEGQIPPGRQMANIMGKSHILALPSHHEGRSNVIVEAMASGRPVVASDTEGIRELVENSKAGYLFDVGNADSLAEAMLKLIRKSDDLAKMGETGRNWVLNQKLNWDNTARKYIRLFNNVISS